MFKNFFKSWGRQNCAAVGPQCDCSKVNTPNSIHVPTAGTRGLVYFLILKVKFNQNQVFESTGYRPNLRPIAHTHQSRWDAHTSLSDNT